MGKCQLIMFRNNLFFQGSSRNSLRNHLIYVAYLTLKSIFMNINVKCFSIRNSTEMAFRDLSSSTGPALLQCETEQVALERFVFLLSSWSGWIRAFMVLTFYDFTGTIYVSATAPSNWRYENKCHGFPATKPLKNWLSRTPLEIISCPGRRPVLVLKFPSWVFCPLVLIGPLIRSDASFLFCMTTL